MNKKSNQIDMLSGSLVDKIFLFALPLAASNILQQLFNAADTIVVGRFASNRALAAVGANSSAINLLINLFTGLAIGANVVLANYIGQQKMKKVSEALHSVVAIALLSGVFLMVLGQFVARPILTIMKTPPDVINLAVLYLRLYFLGMPFIMMYNFGSAILRSKGDSNRPLYCLILAGIINVLLNLLLVIGFKLSVVGVAVATIISNGFSASLIFYFLLHEEEDFRLDLKKLNLKREYVIKIIKIGAPAGIQGMVFSFSNVCIQSAINGFGSMAMAGSAAALNFECFGYFIINGFTQACTTFTSQNVGARNYDRCRRVFKITFICAIVGNLVLCALFLIFARPLMSIVTSDTEVIGFGLMRMQRILPADWLMCLYEVSGSALRGMGHSMVPAVITIFGTCIFRLGWVYTIFEKWSSFTMLVTVYPASWLLTGISMMTAYFLIRRKMFRVEV